MTVVVMVIVIGSEARQRFDTSVGLIINQCNSGSLQISEISKYEILGNILATFLKFSQVLPSFQICSDLFRPVRTHSYTSGCIRKPSEVFGRIPKFLILFDNIF